MKKMNINPDHYELTQAMFSQTISMICKEGQHIGLCDYAHAGTKHARHEIDVRHSFLILDQLYP